MIPKVATIDDVERNPEHKQYILEQRHKWLKKCRDRDKRELRRHKARIDNFKNREKLNEYKKKRWRRLHPLNKKNCNFCNEEFIGGIKKLYCNAKCRVNERRRIYFSNKVKIKKYCLSCNEEMEYQTLQKRYCSKKCANKRYNEIKKEKELKRI